MIKRNKIKIIIATIITAITCCIFLISTQAQEGYQVNNEGQIESLNKFNGKLVNGYHSGSNGNLTLINGNLVTNKELISLNHNTYYTISFVATDIYLDGICYYYSNGNFKSYEQLNNQISPFTFILSNEEYFISFNFISNNNIDNSQITNIMLNEGQTGLNYFPYGNYTNDNIIYGANGFYNNVKSITYSDQGNTYISLETQNAYKYLSNATLNLEELLTANGITNTQQRQTRRQLLEIILEKPINLSNFIYYLQFDGNPEGTPPEDYYISFFNDNPNVTGSNDNSIFYFENAEYINNVGYKLELKGSMFINEIDIYWENLETDTCWPYRMTSSEYNIGLETGKNQGYTTGYNNGTNAGIEQGIEQGIQQADSRINKNSASYIAGYNEGEQSTNNLGGMVITIMESPINMFKQMFNFDILGFNLSNFLFSLISLLLIAYIIKKLIK